MRILTLLLVRFFIAYSLFHYAAFAAPTSVPSPPTPKDTWLILTLHDGKYACLYMDANNYAKLYSGKEWYSYCDWIRYDQFSRFSIRKNGQEYCLTMPTSVTTGKEDWDYLRFEPCVVGLYRQLWEEKTENGKRYIVSSKDKWRVLDFEWTLYISKLCYALVNVYLMQFLAAAYLFEIAVVQGLVEGAMAIVPMHQT